MLIKHSEFYGNFNLKINSVTCTFEIRLRKPDRIMKSGYYEAANWNFESTSFAFNVF